MSHASLPCAPVLPGIQSIISVQHPFSKNCEYSTLNKFESVYKKNECGFIPLTGKNRNSAQLRVVLQALNDKKPEVKTMVVTDSEIVYIDEKTSSSSWVVNPT